MECKQVEELLVALCEGSLDSVTTRRLEEHLASCARCMKERTRIAKTLEALHEFETIKPSPDFSAKLWQRIDEWETTRRVVWVTAVAAFMRRNRRALVACSVVFVISLLSGVLVLRDMTGGPAVEVAGEQGPSDGFVIREIPQPVAAADDTVFMHYVTGDRPLGNDPQADNYVLRPVVRPVSDAGPPF
jgi:anti-sigma factor RsiW